MKTTLLATSSTLAGIERMVNAFWCSQRYRVDPDTLAITHPEKAVSGFRVIMKGRRFRFESVRP